MILVGANWKNDFILQNSFDFVAKIFAKEQKILYLCNSYRTITEITTDNDQ